jgi:methylphosphotriester-DNA--protein-cysteine methyltransferase
MIRHNTIDDSEVLKAVKSGLIRYGGNRKQKIYGTLTCKSGKRMKRRNRVFFENRKDAINNGYRPCGNCMKETYIKWTSLST